MKRLEVVWHDASHLTGDWDDRDAVLSKTGRSLVKIRSIGYVLYSDRKVLILAGSFHDTRVGRVALIPRKSIVKRRRLR